MFSKMLFPPMVIPGLSLLLLILSLESWSTVSAFATTTSLFASPREQSKHEHPSWRKTLFRLAMTAGDNNDPVSELTSALARLDQQWQLQQKMQQQSQEQQQKPQWSKLEIDEIAVDDDATRREFVYVLQPPSVSSSDNTAFTSPTPSPRRVIVFIGGLGFGQFPQVAYNEMLVRLCQELNAVVVAVPYSISDSSATSANNNPASGIMGQALDHFELSKQTGERARKAIIQLQNDKNNNNNLPVYFLTHSLGGKLAVIYMAAVLKKWMKDDDNIAGMGLISFNNFGFGQSFQLVKEFAKQFTSPATTTATTGTILDQLFGMAETALSVMGVEFSPSPEQMNRLVAMKYNTNSDMPPTRLFTFAQDNLENTRDFFNNACNNNDYDKTSSPQVDVSLLPGTHLTPVMFKLDLDQILTDDKARQVVKDYIGLEQASFVAGGGDNERQEQELDLLVQEIVAWIQHEKGPTQRPPWMSPTTNNNQTPPPLIAGSTTTN